MGEISGDLDPKQKVFDKFGGKVFYAADDRLPNRHGLAVFFCVTAHFQNAKKQENKENAKDTNKYFHTFKICEAIKSLRGNLLRSASHLRWSQSKSKEIIETSVVWSALVVGSTAAAVRFVVRVIRFCPQPAPNQPEGSDNQYYSGSKAQKQVQLKFPSRFFSALKIAFLVAAVKNATSIFGRITLRVRLFHLTPQQDAGAQQKHCGGCNSDKQTHDVSLQNSVLQRPLGRRSIDRVFPCVGQENNGGSQTLTRRTPYPNAPLFDPVDDVNMGINAAIVTGDCETLCSKLSGSHPLDGSARISPKIPAQSAENGRIIGNPDTMREPVCPACFSPLHREEYEECQTTTHNGPHLGAPRWTMMPDRAQAGFGRLSSLWRLLPWSRSVRPAALTMAQAMARLRRHLLHPPSRRQPRKLSKNNIFGGGLLVAAITALTGPAFAQVAPFDEVAGYDIAAIPDNGVCFGVVQLQSEAGATMIYSYYQTVAGQRWHVASYANVDLSDSETVAIRVAIDGTETLVRDAETRDGDFMLPFQALDEIQAHEQLTLTGTSMVIGIGDADSLTVPLEDFRAALSVIQSCIEAQ